MNADRYDKLLQEEREGLRIVLLGPGEAQPNDMKKRRQIACRLRELGYTLATMGEDLLRDVEAPLHLALELELQDIDLLLVLNAGPAPLAELTAISRHHRARQITRVWSKREYTEGSRSTPGDVVRMFDNLLFSSEEFESCDLVGEFVEAAERFCFNKAQSEGRLEELGLPPG